MSEITHRISFAPPARVSWFSRFQVLALAALALIAIIFKFYLPRLVPNTEWLELPLLLTVYFGLMRGSRNRDAETANRSPIAALFFGAFVGLAEDSLAPANIPVGMYGITMTLVGYFAAEVSLRLNLERTAMRPVLCFFFYFFHAFFYWIMRRALLSQMVPFDLEESFVFGALNMLVAIPLFILLDRMRLSGPS